MKIKIKKLAENSVIPSYAKDGDAGMDLTATSKTLDLDGNVSYGIGLAFAIPKGYVGLLFPRSSNSKKDLILSNSVGVLDSGYNGEVFLKYKPSETFLDFEGSNWDGHLKHYDVGDRVGQLIVLPYPEVEFEEVEELPKTERGDGGFGSSGK